MKINEVKTAKKVGSFELKNDNNLNKIKLNYNTGSLSDKELKEDIPRVYLIVSNEEIKKIGGSSGRGGIKTTISFYENATKGSPGPVRFIIHQLILKELEKNNNVEIYMITSPKVKANVSGLFRKFEAEIASFKEMEDRCKLDYVIFTLKKFLDLQNDNREIQKIINNHLKKMVKSLENLDKDFENLKQFIFSNNIENIKNYLEKLKNESKKINNYFFKNVFNKVNEKNIKNELKEYYDDSEKIKNLLFLKLQNKYKNISNKPKSVLKTQLKNLENYGIKLKIFPDWNFQENNESYSEKYNDIYKKYLEYHENRTSKK